MGTLLLFGEVLQRQRGLVAVATAAAWDGCCRPLRGSDDSVGTLLLFVAGLSGMGALGSIVGPALLLEERTLGLPTPLGD